MSTIEEPTLFRWTRNTYERAGEVGIFGDLRVELVEGQVVQMSPMGAKHATICGLVADALTAAFGPWHHVRVQFPISLGDRSEPEPDIAVVRGARKDFFHSHPVAAELVIEISEATLNFDRNTKSRIYALAGIPEYWIVNLEGEQIEVFRQPQSTGIYAEKQIVKRGESLSPLGAPGAILRVDDLFS